MRENTKKLTFTAMLVALSMVILTLSAVLPTGRLALVAIAGLLPAAVVIRFGIPSAALCYAATGILSLVLLPDKGNAVLYLLIFGHYPMVKSLIERLHRLVPEWILKLLVFNLVFSVLYFGFTAVFTSVMTATVTFAPFVYLAGNLAFVIYDIGFSRLICFYRQKFDKFINGGRE